MCGYIETGARPALGGQGGHLACSQPARTRERPFLEGMKTQPDSPLPPFPRGGSCAPRRCLPGRVQSERVSSSRDRGHRGGLRVPANPRRRPPRSGSVAELPSCETGSASSVRTRLPHGRALAHEAALERAHVPCALRTRPRPACLRKAEARRDGGRDPLHTPQTAPSPGSFITERCPRKLEKDLLPSLGGGAVLTIRGLQAVR